MAQAHVGYDYFLQRVGQVSSLSGSAISQQPPSGLVVGWDTPLGLLLANLRALYVPGAGGIGGYAFGGLSFFSPLALALFVLGLATALYRGARGLLLQYLSPAAGRPSEAAASAASVRDRAYLYVVGALVAAFVSGMVLTVPPGALHRISVVYPLIGLTMAVGLYVPLDLARRVGWKHALPVRAVRVALALVVVASLGLELDRAYRMASHDQTHESPIVDRYVESAVPPGGLVVVVAFPQYHLARELFIRSGGQRRFETRSLPSVIDGTSADALVVLGPTENGIQAIQAAYPDARLIRSVDGHELTQHLIVVPGPHR